MKVRMSVQHIFAVEAIAIVLTGILANLAAFWEHFPERTAGGFMIGLFSLLVFYVTLSLRFRALGPLGEVLLGRLYYIAFPWRVTGQLIWTGFLIWFLRSIEDTSFDNILFVITVLVSLGTIWLVSERNPPPRSLLR